MARDDPGLYERLQHLNQVGRRHLRDLCQVGRRAGGRRYRRQLDDSPQGIFYGLRKHEKFLNRILTSYLTSLTVVETGHLYPIYGRSAIPLKYSVLTES